MQHIEILKNQIIERVKTCNDAVLMDLILKLFPTECDN